MSSKTSEKSPLITYGRCIDINNAGIVFSMLALFVPIVAFYITPNAAWAQDLWPFFPAIGFFLGMTAVAIVQMRKCSVINKQSAENISSYLSKNYGIFVSPKSCSAYCGKHLVPNNIILNAENSETGKNIRISLKFSEDLTHVEPLLAGIPMKRAKFARS